MGARRDRTGKSVAISPFSAHLIKTIRYLCTYIYIVHLCVRVCVFYTRTVSPQETAGGRVGKIIYFNNLGRNTLIFPPNQNSKCVRVRTLQTPRPR